MELSSMVERCRCKRINFREKLSSFELGIDNESYYNGVLNPGTSWELDWDIDPETNPGGLARLFFNFTDLKPGDWGEDTISLHVKDNASWLCADVTLRSDDDNSITEPEEDDGDLNTAPGIGTGDLADAVNFYWWGDDGDNVFECTMVPDPQNPGGPRICDPLAQGSEHLLPAGPLGNLDVGDTATVALADSNGNIWGDDDNALPGGSTRFIGKAWCFGRSNFLPYAQDGLTTEGPDVRDVQCDGSGVNNITQTDSMTVDITFRAEQSRHQSDFTCDPDDVEGEPR